MEYNIKTPGFDKDVPHYAKYPATAFVLLNF
jgi:hypothetical protein